MDVSTQHVADLLAGMDYPARMWEVVAWAQYNGANPVMINALSSIPERDYFWPEQIVDALHDGQAAVGCHHRRHPRRCPHRGPHPNDRLTTATT